MAAHSGLLTRAADLWCRLYKPGNSRAEKILLSKFDLFILLYCCLTFFVKYLDQTNVTNAWAAGLRNDKVIRPQPNDLNLLTTYFNVGVIVGCLLGTPLLSAFPPNLVLPSLTLVWSFFVLFMYKAQNIQTLFALRFCAGLFEATAFPGAFYIIGSWYRRHEIHSRSAIFLFSSVVGAMVSSFIQSGLSTGIGGRLGIPAWRWLFIFNFIIGLPVALFGFLCCPNDPWHPRRVWWMTEAERDMSRKRLFEERKAEPEPWTWNTVRRIVTSWRLYAFVVAYGILEIACGTLMLRWFILFLQSMPEYASDSQSYKVNQIAAADGGAQMFWLLGGGIVADRMGRSIYVILIAGLLQLFAYIVFAVWPNNMAFKFAMYFVGAAYEVIPALLTAWANVSIGADKQLRACTVGFMIAMGYTTETLAQQFRFPTANAPSYKKTNGYIFGSAWVGIFLVYTCFVLPTLERFMVARESGGHLRDARLTASPDSDEEAAREEVATGELSRTEGHTAAVKSQEGRRASYAFQTE